mmetsp:Transcript_7018/g.20284  ORF Transcript_7018/g.20284 Transcript_7018/m.20284 type:complete len:404 (-) Transcript_7018:169-1380(-)
MVSVLPLGELLEHAVGIRNVLEWLVQEPRQCGKLRFEAEEHGGNGSLNLVEERGCRVRVVGHHPLSAEGSLILQHLLEAHGAVLVLGDGRAKRCELPPTLGLGPQFLLLGDQGRRQRWSEIEGYQAAAPPTCCGGVAAGYKVRRQSGAIAGGLSVSRSRRGGLVARLEPSDLAAGTTVAVQLGHHREIINVLGLMLFVPREVLGEEDRSPWHLEGGLQERGILLPKDLPCLVLRRPPLPGHGRCCLDTHPAADLAVIARGQVALEHVREVHFVGGLVLGVELEAFGLEGGLGPVLQVLGFKHRRIFHGKVVPGLIVIFPLPRHGLFLLSRCRLLLLFLRERGRHVDVAGLYAIPANSAAHCRLLVCLGHVLEVHLVDRRVALVETEVRGHKDVLWVVVVSSLQ